MAADELFEVRPVFVQAVSDEIINELLDDLLRDNVLGRGERQAILGVNQITPEKARKLIDTVVPKGNKACSKMIGSIQSRDPALYSLLFVNQE